MPDVLAAIELLKLSLLSESGITVARSRVLVVTVGLLLAAVVTFLFLSSR